MKSAWMVAAALLGLGLVGACEPSAAGKLPAAGPDAVAVTIETEPSGSAVLIDGAPAGILLPRRPFDPRGSSVRNLLLHIQSHALLLTFTK